MGATGIDEAKLGEFMGRMVGYMTGGAACFGIWLGDELGLYSVLADNGPRSVDEVAAKAGCNPRLVREWLDGQVAAGLVGYDADADSYSLSPEGTMVLADDSSPVFSCARDECLRLDVQRHGEAQSRLHRGWRVRLGRA